MPYIACQACNFWVQPGRQQEAKGGQQSDLGQCRKYAPSPMPGQKSGNAKTLWPVTDSDDGCGEGEIREERARRGRAA
jgi:hypothetical protein